MPELVQFGNLTPAHFDRVPVWAACSSFDYDAPWYGDTDEETFRPWDAMLPAPADGGMLLVRIALRLADGTALSGFVTPMPGPPDGEPRSLGTMQPQLYLPDGKIIGFWLGMFGDPAAERQRLYAALGREASAVFPITFLAEPGLVSGTASGTIDGFYTVPDGKTVTVAR